MHTCSLLCLDPELKKVWLISADLCRYPAWVPCWHAQSGGGFSAGAIAVLETGKKVRARCLIGTDGANSRVARALNVPKPNYAGYAAYRSDMQCRGVQCSTSSKFALVFELLWYLTPL